jgi:hypothetical protein
MATTIKNLGAGTITTISTTNVGPTAATGKSWLIKSLILTNKDTVPRGISVNVVNAAGTTALVSPQEMSIPPKGTAVVDSEITLMAPLSGNADKVTLVTTISPAGGIDWVANGVERDVV